jgi:Gas vesicle protein G
MGLLSMILGLPLAPVRGVIKLSEVIQRQVDEELHSPVNVRRELEEIQRRRESGELTEEEEAEAQQQVIDRISRQRGMKEG